MAIQELWNFLQDKDSPDCATILYSDQVIHDQSISWGLFLVAETGLESPNEVRKHSEICLEFIDRDCEDEGTWIRVGQRTLKSVTMG